jgi:hypothetical protein
VAGIFLFLFLFHLIFLQKSSRAGKEPTGSSQGFFEYEDEDEYEYEDHDPAVPVTSPHR